MKNQVSVVIRVDILRTDKTSILNRKFHKLVLIKTIEDVGGAIESAVNEVKTKLEANYPDAKIDILSIGGVYFKPYKQSSKTVPHEYA